MQGDTRQDRKEKRKEKGRRMPVSVSPLSIISSLLCDSLKIVSQFAGVLVSFFLFPLLDMAHYLPSGVFISSFPFSFLSLKIANYPAFYFCLYHSLSLFVKDYSPFPFISLSFVVLLPYPFLPCRWKMIRYYYSFFPFPSLLIDDLHLFHPFPFLPFRHE